MRDMACVLACIAVAVSAGGASVGEWPADELWLEEAEYRAASGQIEREADLLEYRVEEELTMVRGSDAIVLGRVSAVTPHVAANGNRRTAITIRVAQCLKGDCEGDTVIAYMSDGEIGPLPPEVGSEYLLCLWHGRISERELLFGGYPENRFEIRGGVVVRKGMLAEEFLDLVRRLVEERAPHTLLRRADLAAVGPVVDYEYSHKSPPAPRVSKKHRGNYVEILVERVLRGDITVGSTVMLVLPYKFNASMDVPLFTEGEHVLVFGSASGDGAWRPCCGKDSRVPVRADGSLSSYTSIDALVERATRP